MARRAEMAKGMLIWILLYAACFGGSSEAFGQNSKHDAAMDLMWRAVAEARVGEVDSCVAYVDSALSTDPDLACANIERGQMWATHPGEDWTKAEYYFEKGLRLLYKPDQPLSPFNMPVKEVEADTRCFLGLVYCKLAMVARDRGNEKEAQTYIGKSGYSAERGLALGPSEVGRGVAEEVLKMINPHDSADKGWQVVGADSCRISAHDVNVLTQFEKLTRKWNVVCAPMVRDLLDPNISGEVWVKESRPIIVKMRSIHRKMLGYAMSVEDGGLRKTWMKFVENYRAKLYGVTAMQLAIANGDAEGQKVAEEAIGKAASEGTAMGMELMDKLRSVVGGQMILKEMMEGNKEVDGAEKKP